MNITDTQKYLVSGKLKVQRENEHIANVDAARNLGIPANYVSMICNPAQWEKCPAWAWNKANTWYNSGQKLSEYSVARSAVSSSRNDELKPEVKEKLIAETKHAMKKTAKEVQKEAQRKDDEKSVSKKDLHTDKKIEVIPPGPECIEELDAVKIKIIIDLQLYINGKEIKL